MDKFPEDIYTEPEPDVDTLANLGPLTGMAGIWTGTHSIDVNPKPDGPEKQAFIEHVELQPIDAQTNGPQLFYGLRYHTRIIKPDDVETFHDQVGYWLWEPSTGCGDPDAFDTARTGGDGGRSCRSGRKVVSPRGGSWFRDERDRLQSVSRIRVQDHELHDHGHDPCRRNVVLRAGHGVDHSRAGGAVSSHRSQHAPEKSANPRRILRRKLPRLAWRSRTRPRVAVRLIAASHLPARARAPSCPVRQSASLG